MIVFFILPINTGPRRTDRPTNHHLWFTIFCGYGIYRYFTAFTKQL